MPTQRHKHQQKQTTTHSSTPVCHTQYIGYTHFHRIDGKRSEKEKRKERANSSGIRRFSVSHTGVLLVHNRILPHVRKKRCAHHIVRRLSRKRHHARCVRWVLPLRMLRAGGRMSRIVIVERHSALPRLGIIPVVVVRYLARVGKLRIDARGWGCHRHVVSVSRRRHVGMMHTGRRGDGFKRHGVPLSRVQSWVEAHVDGNGARWPWHCGCGGPGTGDTRVGGKRVSRVSGG